MAGGPTVPRGAANRHRVTVDDVELRQLVPQVLSVLVRRGADFATAEDAVQEALIRGISAWQEELPSDPKAWLITVAWRAFVDLARSDAARRDREVRFDTEPPTGAVPSADDTLHLYFLCAHPELTPSSAVALTLRAVGGLTTRQIAQAYLVPESTMAQRISRAKRTVGRSGLDRPGNVRTVMRVLYLIFNEGYSGDVDLAAEAIRLTRQLASSVNEPEVQGLLALMLLHHAPAQPHPTRRTDRAARGPGPEPVGQRTHRRGNRHRASSARTRPARRVPDASRDRRPPRRCDACRGDRLGPDRGVVRRAAGVRRYSNRPAQPCRRRRRSGRRSRGLAALGQVDEHIRGEMRSPHISTRRTETSNSLPASMPTQPTTHPTWLSATTRCAKRRDSTRCCATTNDG